MLAPWKKAKTNLDSILKSREITLLTKFHIIKAMVFPVVWYGCEIWYIKKAEGLRIDAFKLWCWSRPLRVPWTASISNQLILKEINLEHSLEGLMLKLKLQYFSHLMWRANSLEKNLMLEKLEGRKRRGQQRMRRLGGQWTWAWAHSGDSEGQGSLLCCSPWSHKQTDLIGDEQQQYSWRAVILQSCLRILKI